MLDGKRLKRIRRELHLTQAELAINSNLSQQAISLYERQVRGSKIPYDTLCKLANALGKAPADLLVATQPDSPSTTSASNSAAA